jgi:hypothetical protein
MQFAAPPDFSFTIHSTTNKNMNRHQKLDPSNMQNGLNNTEHDTKCAPCRLFRKGDKVQVIKRDGRCNGKAGEYLREAFCTVAEDEIQNELVRVFHHATEYRLDPAYLVLVTPHEEQEPYSVGVSIDVCILYKYGEYYGEFVNRIEAERVSKLLNAEHKKEQK